MDKKRMEEILPGKDMTQMTKILMKPEIRVWMHPIAGGDDYWYVYPTIKAAKADIIKKRDEWIKGTGDMPEDEPMIAYLGLEYTLKGFTIYWKERLKF